MGVIRRALAALLLVVALCAVGSPARAQTHYTGTLPSGATWVADVPADWNGTMILYSHGFGPLVAQNAPNDETRTALLAEGYGLVGSSYSGPSLWALENAVDDQFGALTAISSLVGEPRRTIAWGTSMGGLVSALEAERGSGRIDGSLTTCGLVGGALNLNNYQLDGEWALSRLLGVPVPLVNYPSEASAVAAASALSAAITSAQATPAGRARVALAAALINTPGWFTGAAPPTSYSEQQAQQAAELSQFVLRFVMPGRVQIELAAGGNSAYNVGVNYAALLHHSVRAPQVRALYRSAGLDLRADLKTLTRDASVTADPRAVASLRRTSVPTGLLRVPELTIHTVADQLIPVEHENWYRSVVTRAGRAGLLRQGYVRTTGHCAFRTAETVGALRVLERRIVSGKWGPVNASTLNTAAGGTGRYVDFSPPPLVGARR
ncbi:alpha/beta hydrolase [Cryptosporangium minutisporangium]|uniref:Alpha/beta hydrolase n=1 Tax=Cryptosporangium minutisporangium TaxID=113569 RepID=A0ABP6SPZ5_9ACTN